MFRQLLGPSSGARNHDVDYHIAVSFLVCCRLEVRYSYAGVVSGLQAKMNSVVISIIVASY